MYELAPPSLVVLQDVLDDPAMNAAYERLKAALPAGTPTGRELHAYSRLLNAVEGNTTFYASPPATTVNSNSIRTSGSDPADPAASAGSGRRNSRWNTSSALPPLAA